MTKRGFRFGRLRVTGPAPLVAADLTFRPGLNVVAGATSTGKTHIVRCLDFLMGASTPPEPNDASEGYAKVEAEILADGRIWTISRAMGGGNALLAEGPIEGAGPRRTRTLGFRHKAEDTGRISGFFLELSGLLGLEVRKDAFGGKDSLSFRDVAPLILVEETRIISEKSPLGVGERGDETKERSVAGLLLTGLDDSAIVPEEKSKVRKARLAAQSAVLQAIAAEDAEVIRAAGFDAPGLEEKRQSIARAVADASAAVSVLQSSLDSESKTRDQAWRQLQTIRSRRIFVEDQLKRLHLLREHYVSDRARLLASIEAGEVFASLPSSACPLCGRPCESTSERETTSERLSTFRAACRAEIEKIELLDRDLGSSVLDLQGELTGLAASEAEVSRTWEDANARLTKLTSTDDGKAQARLKELLREQTELVRLEERQKAADRLRRRATEIELAKRARVEKPTFAPKMEARTVSGLLEVLTATLEAWRFPYLGRVGYDVARNDFTIGTQNRIAFGKGHRALTHAAVVVSILRYCRQSDLPHPGLVILDTPLNPLRGRDEPGEEKVSKEVQNAFYEDLARNSGEDQIIVMENEDPSEAIRSLMNYQHFSGNPDIDRYGFYPVRTRR